MRVDFTLEELLVWACADAFRGDGEILCSPIGPIPTRGARLARATFAPDLLLAEEARLTYRAVFDVVWAGRRHVMMGASQIDSAGNQNISCIGADHARPRTQLIGARGAPGNTIHHATSYFVDKHSPRVFVPRVDFVSGVGHDRGVTVDLRRVISDKAVLDFEGGVMRLRSVHPGVTVDEVVALTGFPLVIPPEVPTTRGPTADELRIIRA